MHAAGITESDGVNSVEICEPMPYLGPSLGDAALAAEKDLLPESILDREEKRQSQERHRLRVFSLTCMLRQGGIRRSISRKCDVCGKTISANKSHCAAHAPKE